MDDATGRLYMEPERRRVRCKWTTAARCKWTDMHSCSLLAASSLDCDDCHVARSGSSDVARLGARPLRVAQYFPCLDGVSNFDVEP